MGCWWARGICPWGNALKEGSAWRVSRAGVGPPPICEKLRVDRNAVPGTRHYTQSSCLQEIVFRGPHPRHLPCRCSSPLHASAQQDRRRKQSTALSSLPVLAQPTVSSDPFGGEQIIHQSVILRGIKSAPFREENILCYVTGSYLHPASLLQKGRA